MVWLAFSNPLTGNPDTLNLDAIEEIGIYEDAEYPDQYALAAWISSCPTCIVIVRSPNYIEVELKLDRIRELLPEVVAL